MKAKKLLITSLLFSLVLFTTAGCAPITKYDKKQVVKIETQTYNGEGIVGCRRRLFDFETGTVTDEVVISDIEFDYLLELYVDYQIGYPEYENAEKYREYLLSSYNVPVPVSEFSREDGNGFVRKVKSLGIYTWKENYINKRVCDASTKNIIITFADGTTKTTCCYCKYPGNFEKAEKAFTEYFGARAWCDLRLR